MSPSPDNPQEHDYPRYALIVLLMVGLMLVWQAWQNSRDFRDYHRQLAENSVNGAANEMELLLSELQRSMRLFADEHRDLFNEISSNPDNEAAWILLEQGVHRHFPEHYGMVLTDKAGDVLRPDFDNRVDTLCQQDIYAFIEDDYSLQGYIHPNPQSYHFDIMVPWGKNDTTQGVFFLSFPPDMLARILQNIHPPGHELLLLRSDRKGLIEVTAEGSRLLLKQELFLGSDEQSRLLATRDIDNSRWELVDLSLPGLFRNQLMHTVGYAVAVFVAFMVVGLLMLHQLRRKEKHRQQAEALALHHQADLAHIDRINTMGEMASSLAHELNQPLTAISTYCQAGLRLLEEDEIKTDKLAHALEHASLQTQRSGQIIRQMRRLAGKGMVRREPISVNEVIKEAINFTGEELKRKAITLTLDLDDDLPDIVADKTQIEQVVLNLLHNAIEAMFSGSENARRLLVSSARTDKTTIRVTVNDTGPGMDKATLDSIFDTFFTTRKNGMGLGLSISRSIIEAHGGRLWAHSAPRTGSTFSFTLNSARA